MQAKNSPCQDCTHSFAIVSDHRYHAHGLSPHSVSSHVFCIVFSLHLLISLHLLVSLLSLPVKARAQAVGLEGALWPWESAVLGSGVELNIIK